MTTTAKRLATAQLSTSASALYTAASGVRAVVKRAAFCNTSAGAITITVYLIPSGGSAGDATCVLDTVSIAAGETYIAGEVESQVIEPAGSIQALASATTSITAIISGIEIS